VRSTGMIGLVSVWSISSSAGTGDSPTSHPVIGSILPIGASDGPRASVKRRLWRRDYKRVAKHARAGHERAVHRARLLTLPQSIATVYSEEYLVFLQFTWSIKHRSAARRRRGFSLVELMVVVLVVLVLTAMAIPQIQAALYTYRLNAAVSASTWAIQTTRYQAIMHGYPYQVAFNAAQNSFQILSEPGGVTPFANVGTAVPFAPTVVIFSPSTTLQFSPNGSVTAVLGQMIYTVAYQGATKTVTVSNYGSITVH
jgi:prepilin-type N-terminal cleavage/methylation domain-containing protein